MTASDQSLLATAFRRRPGTAEAVVDGETVVFQPERESLTVLDPVGSLIWTLLDGSASLHTLSEELAEAYGAPLTQVQHDLVQLIIRLKQDELLADDPP